MARGPRVVAELGRPETAAETAARKAESSRVYRSSQTTRNLIAALLVTIAMLATSTAVAPVSREVADLLEAVSRGGIATLPLSERIVVAPYSLVALRNRRLSPVAQRCREMVAEALVGESRSEGGR